MFCFVRLYYSCLSRIVWNRIAPWAEIYNACINFYIFDGIFLDWISKKDLVKCLIVFHWTELVWEKGVAFLWILVGHSELFVKEFLFYRKHDWLCFSVERDDKKMMTVPRFVMFVFNYREQVSLEGNVTDQKQIGNQ